MSDELTIQTGFQYDKNGRLRPMAAASSTVDVAGDGVHEGVQGLGQSSDPVPIDLGSVVEPGFFSFRNANAYAGWIKVGTKDGAGAFVSFAKLLVGKPACQVFLDEEAITGTNLLCALVEGPSVSWENDTHYAANTIVIDTDDSSNWVCLVDHTSAAEGTFATDRTAHPTYWGAYVTFLDYAINDR